MKYNELKKDIWYKLDPYSDGRFWYIKPEKDGNSRASAYINDDKEFYEVAGNFGTDYDFTEAIPEEVNKLLPDEYKIILSYELY